MYVILVYDISVERVNKARQYLKRSLSWIQNSAFEGELTEGELEKVKLGLKEIINEKEDSILIFTTPGQKWLKKEVMGIEKSEITNVI